jgi:hypothetical protein
MRLSVLIPVAPYHTGHLQTALDSLKAQTEAVNVLYAIDHEQRGPGFIRNQLLKDVRTPYVTFLDADDWIAPTFAQVTCDAMQPGRYVYTDWMQDTEYIKAPEKAWCAGTWHPITAVVHTQDALNVSGFDEQMPALEDTDFWLKLVTRHICGIHIKQALFHYGPGGRRGKGAVETGLADKLRQVLMRKHGGKMGCCGKGEVGNKLPIGEKQPGDVLAMALWHGNRGERGRATGRRYPRMSYPRQTWVHPADIEKRPDLWQQVHEPTVGDAAPVYEGIGELQQALQGTGFFGKQTAHEPVLAELGDYHPDLRKILDVASERL